MRAHDWLDSQHLIADHMRRCAELEAAGVKFVLPERLDISYSLPPTTQALTERIQRHEEATKNLNVGTY